MANRNEAKVTFLAETEEFRDQVRQANNEMSELRAELKLNDLQMKATGDSVKGLENKHENLTKQLEAAKRKTEALAQEVEVAVRKFGENSDEASRLRRQLTSAQTAEEKLRQAVRQCADELSDQRREADKTESATEKLTDTIEKQQTELDDLKGKYQDAVLQYGKTSDEAKALAREIKDLSGDLKDNQTELGKAEKAANDLDKSFDNAADGAVQAGDGFTVLKGVVADLASQAIQMAIDKIGEFIGYLADLPEATRELRQDMTTLTTSFDNMGFSTDQAKGVWKDLYAVFGEDDRAVEAANHISKMADNQKELNDWVTITTGVFGTYQDSLPVEGLAEAANETSKTGTVTGVLADALNWSSEAAAMFAGYMSEDVVTAEDAFNEALKECTTEQERQQLITDTLTALYGNAAQTYRDTAGAQMEAKAAVAEHMLAENDLATAIEPVTTAWQEMKTTLLVELAPAIEAVSGVLVDAIGWMKEHPTTVQALATAIGILAAGFSGLAIGLGIYTVAQLAANAALLPVIGVIAAVIAIVALLAAAIVAIVKHWDDIVAAVKRCWESVKETLSQWGEWINTNVIQPVVEFFKGLWDSIKTACSDAWEWVKGVFSSFVEWVDTNLIQPVVNFFKNLWDSIKNIWDQICNVVEVAIMFIGEILHAAGEIILLPFRFIWENCKEYVFAAWEWIKEKVSGALDFIKNYIDVAWTAIKSATTVVWNAIKTAISNVWNAIKSAVTKAITAVKEKVSSVWNAIKTYTSTVWNVIKGAISTVWNNIKTAVSNAINAVKEKISGVWNHIKNYTSTVWTAIKGVISNVWSNIKNNVSEAIGKVKSVISDKLNDAKNTISNILGNIKDKFKNIFDNVKNVVKNAIDKVKSYFNFKWELPKIKLPHFKISGKFSLNPPSVPRFNVEWYKLGAIFTKPTLFNTPYGLKGVGEAGAEAVLPIDKLQGYISNAIDKAQNVVNLETLAYAIEDLANRPIELNINGRQFALATASDGDSVNGLRSSFKGRGLVLD